SRGLQMQLPLEIQRFAQIGVQQDPALRIDLGIAAQIVGGEHNVVEPFRVVAIRLKKLFILAPQRNRVYLPYAAVEAGDEKLVLRQSLEKIDEVGGQLQPVFI